MNLLRYASIAQGDKTPQVLLGRRITHTHIYIPGIFFSLPPSSLYPPLCSILLHISSSSSSFFSLSCLFFSCHVRPQMIQSKQAKRAEFEALQEEHEAKHKEISARGRMALADFLLGTSDMTSPASGGGRTGGLATVMEEGSPRGASGRWLEFGFIAACTLYVNHHFSFLSTKISSYDMIVEGVIHARRQNGVVCCVREYMSR